MALQFNYNMDNGINLSEAYAKIDIVTINYSNEYAFIAVDIFKNMSSRESGASSVDRIDLSFPEDFNVEQSAFETYLSATAMSQENSNVLSQAYALVKEANFFKLKNPTDI